MPEPIISTMAHLSLLNRRIVLTRPEDQSESIASQLKKAGATVLLVPTIKIIPAELLPEGKFRISSFYGYDFVIFPSANSVKYSFKQIVVDKHSAAKPYIVAIGKRTAEALAVIGFNADFIPGKFTSEELIKSLSKFEWKEKKVLIPIGNLSNGELADFVKSKGALADQVIVYETTPNDSIDETMKSEIRLGRFDMIIFYSPSQVKNFIDIFGSNVLKTKPIVVIGPTTKKAVERHGFEVAIVPGNSTTEDLMKSLFEYEKI